MKLTLLRDVPKSECPWLDKDMKKGAVVYSYNGCTYGCVSSRGMACTNKPDETPFFELPASALH